MRSLLLASLLALTSCSGNSRDDTASAPGGSAAPAPLIQTSIETKLLTNAPPRFRPGGWSDERTLWGLVRGRVTRFDIITGQASTRPQTAWWIQAAPDVVTWRNEGGIWIQRGGGEPVRLSESAALGPDGIATVLLSPDGRRALLGWQHEWDARYELLLGRVARDAVPAFSPSGRRGLVATARGSVLFEVTRASTGP